MTRISSHPARHPDDSRANPQSAHAVRGQNSRSGVTDLGRSPRLSRDKRRGSGPAQTTDPACSLPHLPVPRSNQDDFPVPPDSVASHCTDGGQDSHNIGSTPPRCAKGKGMFPLPARENQGQTTSFFAFMKAQKTPRASYASRSEDSQGTGRGINLTSNGINR